MAIIPLSISRNQETKRSIDTNNPAHKYSAAAGPFKHCEGMWLPELGRLRLNEIKNNSQIRKAAFGKRSCYLLAVS